MLSVGKSVARFTDLSGLFGRQQRTPPVLGAEGVRSVGAGGAGLTAAARGCRAQF